MSERAYQDLKKCQQVRNRWVSFRINEFYSYNLNLYFFQHQRVCHYEENI